MECLFELRVAYVCSKRERSGKWLAALTAMGCTVGQLERTEEAIDADGRWAAAVIDCSDCSLAHALALASRLRARQRPIGVVFVECAWKTLETLEVIRRADCRCLDRGAEAPQLEAHLQHIASEIDVRNSRAAGILSWGPFSVDLIGGFAEVGSDRVDLQPLQLRILGYLIANGGRSVTHEELRRGVFRVSQACDSTSIARQISVLRSKLGSMKALLRTVAGGYELGVPQSPHVVFERATNDDATLAARDSVVQ